VDYPVEEVLHLKYWNPNDPHRGLSPVQAGIDAITAAKRGLESRTRQYQNQGPPGVIFDKKATQAWSADQTRSVRQWLRSFFSGGRNFGEVPITGGELGYLSLGLSPVDLDVLAAIPHDKDAVADLFRFPGQLLNGSRGTTFANMSEARKALYSDCAIPLEAKVRDELNRWLGPEWKDEVYLDFDLSGVPELQEDKAKLATWLNTAWWVKVQDKQRMVGVAADWKGSDYMVPMTLGDPLVEPEPVPDDAPVPANEDAN
jgi:HK97 family phage portal protein